MNKFLLINTIFIFLILSLIFNKKSKDSKDFIVNQNINQKIVEEINKTNKQAKSLYADLAIKQGIFSLYGFVSYEKQNNFKMVSNLLFRKELEIGSNDDLFWFWTRSENTLYFCNHKDVEKTRLRVIFYPMVIKTFLGIDEFFDFEIIENKIIQKLSNDIIKISIIHNNKIIAHELHQQNKIILRCDIIEFYNNLPKKIKIDWIEENIKQEWTLSNIKINEQKFQYDLPKCKNMINLKNY